MVLCQVVVTQANFNDKLYPINVFGQKKIRLLKIDYSYTGSTVYFIQIRSNILRIPTGNSPFLLFVNNPNYQTGNISNHIEWNSNLNGNLDLDIVEFTTQLTPAGFVQLVLTFDISDNDK